MGWAEGFMEHTRRLIQRETHLSKFKKFNQVALEYLSRVFFAID
jgi:hypothetical protein